MLLFWPESIPPLIHIYVYSIIYAALTTIGLVVLRLSWGPVPELYVHCVRTLQTFVGLKAINREGGKGGGGSSKVDENNNEGDAADLQAAVRSYAPAPVEMWTLLDRPLNAESKLHHILYVISFLIRWLWLLPVRLILLSVSIGWFALWAAIASQFTLRPSLRHYASLTFARLFCSGIGVVTLQRGKENITGRPGIAVANHLSANDIIILYADLPYHVTSGYAITGQRHVGICGVLEKLGSRLAPALWLDRSCTQQRNAFQAAIKEHAEKPDSAPVLLFPEGYCVNNTAILRFRRAAFAIETEIHPIAVKTRPELGDPFWWEDTYAPHLLRLLTSWATRYETHYLPAMRRMDDETPEAFAERVQQAMADTVGLSALPIDGQVAKRVQMEDRAASAS